jgi:hypothetical protein
MMNVQSKVLIKALAIAVLHHSSRAEGILNGLFSDGLQGWEHVGDVTGVSTNGYTYVRLQETFEATPDDPNGERRPVASRSRLFQEFIVPSDATDLSFRFKFAFSPRTRTGTAPPDAFTAHLLTTNGVRVLPGAQDEPSFTSAFFYIDSDGRLAYDTEHVSVQMTPGPDGMYGVTLKELNSNGLIGQKVRLEFDLATADNGIATAVFMDGVADGSPITPYSGLVAAGVGTATTGAGTINISVPNNAIVVQALLYWSGEHRPPFDGDTDAVAVTINGGTQQNVTGEALGQSPEQFFFNSGWVYTSTYRADITALGDFTTGANAVQIGGMDFNYSTNGAGLVVKYSDGSNAHVDVQDGQDLACAQGCSPTLDSDPKVFTFAAASTPRLAALHFFASSVEEGRPNRICVTVFDTPQGTEVCRDYPLESSDGHHWDTYVWNDISILAGTTNLSVQVISWTGGQGQAASLNWITAGLSLPIE